MWIHTRRRRPKLGFLEQVGPNFVGPSSTQLSQHFITVRTNRWSRFADNETPFPQWPEQAQVSQKAMEIYTLPLVRTDRLQAFEGPVALVYKHTLSSKPLALLRSLPMEILGQN